MKKKLVVISSEKESTAAVAARLRAKGMEAEALPRIGVILAEGDPQLLTGIDGITWTEEKEFVSKK